MSRFEQKYTDRQRLAVARAQLDGGMTAAQAIAALHAGELSDADGKISAPPAPMPKRTAQDLARRMRAEREGRSTGLANVEPAAARKELGRRLIVSADRLTRRLERKSRTGTKDAELADALHKAARAVREVDAYFRAQEKPAAPPPPSDGKPSGEKPSAPSAPASPLAEIAADIDREDRSEAARRRQPPTQP